MHHPPHLSFYSSLLVLFSSSSGHASSTAFVILFLSACPILIFFGPCIIHRICHSIPLCLSYSHLLRAMHHPPHFSFYSSLLVLFSSSSGHASSTAFFILFLSACPIL